MHTEPYMYPVQNYDDDSQAQYPMPRVPSDVAPLEGRNNYANEIRGDNEQSSVRIPTEIEEEISRFRIPVRLAPRITRKPKVKKNRAKVKKNRVKQNKEKIRSQDEENEMEDEFDQQEPQQEEEEETEEKKEKIHKVTIKKKRPLKNGTNGAEPLMSAQPYRTIPESSYEVVGVGPGPMQMMDETNGPHSSYRKPVFVHKMRGSQSNPLLLKENLPVLNPAYYEYQDQQGVRKGIKPRDVNVILRSKNRGPRILIRKYKPVVGAAIAYPFLKPSAVGIGLVQGKRKKRRRRKQRKRKKILGRGKVYHGQVDTDYQPPHGTHGTYGVNQASCSNEHPQMVNSFSASADHLDSIYPYQSESGDYHANFPATVGQSPMNDYVNVAYENNEFASEPFTSAVPVSSTALPYSFFPYPQKSGQHLTNEVMSVPYDMREHENTEELAASHKQETDENLDEEDAVDANANDNAEGTVAVDDDEEGDEDVADAEVESAEGENAEYENDSEESEDSFFDKDSKRPIKKVDQR